MKPVTVEEAVAEFGALAKAKLTNPSATGEPEDQLRAPFEQLLSRLSVLAGAARADPSESATQSKFHLAGS